jgi:hypothetical protein
VKAADSNLFEKLSEIVIPSARADSFDPDRLLDLTRDSDPGVRQSAVRSLRYYVANGRVPDRLGEILEDDNEVLEVRKEAARSLSALNSGQAVDKMFDIAKGWKSADPALRYLTLKALYNAAAYNSGIRSELTDLAKGWGQSDDELRAAAAWGLFLCSQNDYSVREVLLDLAGSSSQPDRVRFEALKSLYLGVGDYNVGSKLLDWAKDSAQPEYLRYGAVLALSARVNDWSTKSALDDLARSADLPSLRQAAVIAMGGPSRPEIYGYFHTGWRDYATGQYISPIDGQ